MRKEPPNRGRLSGDMGVGDIGMDICIALIGLVATVWLFGIVFYRKSIFDSLNPLLQAHINVLATIWDIYIIFMASWPGQSIIVITGLIGFLILLNSGRIVPPIR